MKSAKGSRVKPHIVVGKQKVERMEYLGKNGQENIVKKKKDKFVIEGPFRKICGNKPIPLRKQPRIEYKSK